VSWDGEVIDVYAINAPDQIIFADGAGFLLRFDGWQITSVEGVLPGDETLSLDVIDDQEEQSLILKYSGLRSKLGRQRCTRWSLVNSSDAAAGGDLIYQQLCDSGTAVATHSLRLNSDRQLLALRFTFHPERPPAIIRYMGN